METNWMIIGIVVIAAIALVAYLIIKNLKDEKEVTEFFNQEPEYQKDDEGELNDNK
ncbi:MAG: hypothetical protein ABIQ27_06710 [Flavobacterium sp.]|uniref:hypothetical protein n=1 Tax=Flavobacterium sp. TaxID=239 RepID=UPI00326592C9